MADIPSGTVTFLFTDIEGSTKLAQGYPAEMPVLLKRHNEILNQAILSHGGYIFQIVGDSFFAAFHSADDAIRAALEAQRALHREAWSPAPIKVRMGIHTGSAQLNEQNQYSGYATLATTQRIMSVGHGGQVLISNSARQLLRNGESEGVTVRDMGERRLKDLIRPEYLYQLVDPTLPADFPPLKTLESYRHNLPTQLTSFIGREQEIYELTQFIGVHRLVTLTGTGGAGKTRLSLQAGAECIERFPNGVWFVELAPLTEPSFIVGAIMTAMGFQEKDNDIAGVARHIGDQSILLILDNCEHLIEDCARLVESLVQACPNLRVLASSREALCIAGEFPYHVPSLRFPDPKHLPDLEEIAACESVQLFVERVRTFTPSFALTDRNASSVAQICSRLDGIPLALELAAARVKVMSVEQMASRLGDIFNLLTSGNRTALPRQQTLRALIEWSYDLLSDPEKDLFRRLAVFSGGWSLEAAESICPAVGSVSVLDDLSRLVDKSLVVKEERDGEVRFHMLETIRQYAEFKMFASEEVEDVKNCHRNWYMQLAETAEPKLRTQEQIAWLNKLEMEHDNFRAAMSWSLEQKHLEQALRIPSALAYFWEIHGHEEEGRNWFKQALGLDADVKKKHPHAWAVAVHGIASISTSTPQFQSYQTHVSDAVDIFREHGDDFRVGHALYHLAYFPHFAGDLESAKTTYQESLEAYQKINDHWGMGECLHCIAHVEEMQGNIETAHELYNQSREALAPVGDRFSLFHPLGDTALIAMYKGELDTAMAILEESVQTFEELGNRFWVANSIDRIAQVLFEQGKYDDARETIQRNLNLVRELNYRNGISWNTYLLGKTALAEGKFTVARQLFNDALGFESDPFMADKGSEQFYVGWVLAALGLTDCYEGNFSQGKEAIEAGIEKVRKQYAPEAAHLLTYRSQAFWLEKDLPEATRSFREAIRESRANYFFIRIPESLEGLGKIAVAQHQLERGASLFGAAQALREKLGTPIPPVQRTDYDAHLQQIGHSFESSWTRGRALTMEEAVRFALED